MGQFTRNGITGHAQDLIWLILWHFARRALRSKTIPSSLVLGFVLSHPASRNLRFLYSHNVCTTAWGTAPVVLLRMVIQWMLIRRNLPPLKYVGRWRFPSRELVIPLSGYWDWGLFTVAYKLLTLPPVITTTSLFFYWWNRGVVILTYWLLKG
jgi:hypothetical protein